MSKRYEFLSGGGELITDPDELADKFGGDVQPGHYALVLGDPYATAAVITGPREQIAQELRDLLAIVEGKPTEAS